MTRSLLLILVASAAAVSQDSRQGPPLPGVPEATGVYCQSEPGKWISLEMAPAADSSIKGLRTFLETDTLSGLNMNFVYRGAHAATRLSDRRPTFVVRGIGSAPDALIVRLAQNRGTRTVQTSSSAASVGNKGGFKRKEIRKVTVVSLADGSFSVTPEEVLAPGEYLLVFGSANAGFDFGIGAADR